VAEHNDSSGGAGRIVERIRPERPGDRDRRLLAGMPVVSGIDAQSERLSEREREPDQLLDADRRAGQGRDTPQPVEARPAQVDRGAPRAREVGADEVAAVERHVLDLRAEEFGPAERGREKADAVQPREPQVRIVQPAVRERDMAQARLREIDRRCPAVDQLHPLPDRLGEVATRQVAANELDVDESSSFERLGGMTRVHDPEPYGFAVVIQ